MALHRSNPAHFTGPGGQEYDAEAFKAETLRSELAELTIGCCLEHGAKIADKILEEYKITPRTRRKYS